MSRGTAGAALRWSRQRGLASKQRSAGDETGLQAAQLKRTVTHSRPGAFEAGVNSLEMTRTDQAGTELEEVTNRRDASPAVVSKPERVTSPCARA